VEKKKGMPQSWRTTTIADKMATIENTLSLLNGDIKKGAEVAMNALRKELRIPLPGEQLDLFDLPEEKKKRNSKKTGKKSEAGKKRATRKKEEAPPPLPADQGDDIPDEDLAAMQGVE
jgi:hypothetical protein